MKNRYRLFRRNGATFYAIDNLTGKRESLRTEQPGIARRVLHAKNEAQEQPQINIQIARAYLAASDAQISTRNWRSVMDVMAAAKSGATRARFIRATNDRALAGLHGLVVLETRPEHLVAALSRGTVATNVFLRRIHNFAVDMTWLPWPLIPKRHWPPITFKEKRAITWDEHLKIIDREPNLEKKAFYELCWHLGGSQGDIASLSGENIDWSEKTIAYRRRKSATPVLIRFGKSVEAVLQRLPAKGPLFPCLRLLRESVRGDYFRRRCVSVGITGVTLHSYRYAWAERARQAGYPERFAQEALGHNSQAVHRAYAKRAQVKVPSLEEFESASPKR
jgi:integrase